MCYMCVDVLFALFVSWACAESVGSIFRLEGKRCLSYVVCRMSRRLCHQRRPGQTRTKYTTRLRLQNPSCEGQIPDANRSDEPPFRVTALFRVDEDALGSS